MERTQELPRTRTHEDLRQDTRLVRLVHVEPLLPSRSSTVYDYTVPELGETTKALIRSQQSKQELSYRVSTRPRASNQPCLEEQLQTFEAARLISTVYSKCLDPLRFDTFSTRKPSKDEIFESFVRRLAAQKLLLALELVARDIEGIRCLDRHQAELGANTVRWMQHLAGESLKTRFLRQASLGGNPEHARLRAALRAISDSVSVLDRFTALARGTL